jgi:hypothetical protein
MKLFPALLLLFTFHCSLFTQQTVGLFQYDPATTDGYTLLAPIPSTNTYLLDNCGRVVHTWGSGYTPGNSVRLLENGDLLRTCRIANTNFNAGGLGGRIQLQDWNGNVTWYYEYTDTDHSQHHDAFPLPNGNIVFITWEAKTRAEAIAAGRDSSMLNMRLWPDALIEVEPTQPGMGNIVWEWHAWDHLVQDFNSSAANFGVVADHPELINLNYSRGAGPNYRDWLHANAVAYNADLDQIALSIHNFDEIWVIDHSTTTAQAATHTGGNSGKGGDLLYRYGNPEAYGRGTANDHIFWGMHDIQWIPAGDTFASQLLVFNNGLARPAGNYSTIDIWQPPVDSAGNYSITAGQPFGPAVLTWSYQDSPPTDFYSAIISGAQRLPGDHTLIMEGTSGRIFEIDAQGNTVWEYINPVQAAGPVNQGDPANNNSVFRAYKYLPGYPGLAGQTLTPGDRLEGNPLPLPPNCLGSGVEAAADEVFSIHPNPFSGEFHVRMKGSLGGILDVYDSQGVLVLSQKVGVEATIQTTHLPAGIYLIKIRDTKGLLRMAKL